LAPALYRQMCRNRSARKISRQQVPMEFGLPDITQVRDDSLYTSAMPDVLGPVFEEDIPIITDTSPENFFAAVEKRVNYYSGASASATFEASMDLLDKKIPERFPEVDWTPELFEEWNSKNAPSKQKAMVAAVDEFSNFKQSKFALKDIFTKVEVLLKSHDPEWAGRLVNNSTDLHNAISGPILQECTKRLHTLLLGTQDDSPCKYYMAYGGLVTDRVATTLAGVDGKVHVVECDFSSNDMTQAKEACLVEAEWLHRLGAPKWLTDIMVKANVYKVYNRTFQFSATISYQLPSGSTSTTFRNCVWNLSIFHQWAIAKTPYGNANATRYVVFVLGDDMIAVIQESRFPVTQRGRYKLAREYTHQTKLARMKAKVKVHQALVDAEFLSKLFCPTSKGYAMFPKLGRALAKINVRANLNPTLSNDEYLLGKYLSYAFEFRYLPLVRDLLLARVSQLEDVTGLTAVTVAEAALTYNYFKIVREIGRAAALRSILVDDEDEISTEELDQFLHYRYGMFTSDLEEICLALFFGEQDLPEIMYRPLAEIDFRS